MPHVFLYTISALLIPFLIGYPIACIIRAGLGLRRIIFGEAIGLAVMVIVIRSLEGLFAVKEFAWELLGCYVVTVALLWRYSSAASRLKKDCARIGISALIIVLISLVGVVVALNLPILLDHALIFEGTGNHDSFYYTVVAHYMQHHSFYAPVAYTPEHPYNEIIRWTFGGAAPIGRVGAEGYLAWLSSLFNRNPAFLYNAASTCGMIVAGSCCLLLLSPARLREIRHGNTRVWLIPAALSTPVLYESVFNSNFSTAYGVAFFSAYLSASWMRSRTPRLVLAVLLMTAMLASYPELVPMAWACLGIGLLFRWRLGRRFIAQTTRDGLRALRDMACSIALFPWIAVPAWYVIFSAYIVMHASGPGTGLPDANAGLAPARYMLATIMANRHIGDATPELLAAIILAMLVFLVFMGVLRGGRNAPLLGGICAAFVVIVGIIYFQSYDYGKLKIVEYFAPLITAVIISGTIGKWGTGSLDRIKAGLIGISSGAVIIVFVVTIGIMINESLFWGRLKRITPATMKLVRAIQALPNGSVISFGSTPWPYYYSMWIPYLSDATFVYSTGFASGGYFSSYVKQHPVAPFTDARYLVQSADAWVGVPYPQAEIARYGDFELLRLDDANSLSVSGLHRVEGRHVWMGKSIELSVRHLDSHVNYLNIFFESRFHPIGPTELVEIKQNHHSCAVEVGTHGQGLSIRLGESSTEDIDIIPKRPPESPYGLGMGGDPRKLTFDVTELGFSKVPKYQPASCQQGG